MKDEILKKLVGAFVHRTLDQLQKDPLKTVKGLTDAAHYIFQGELLTRFEEISHKVQTDVNDPYRKLLFHISKHGRVDDLYTKLMNTGYQGYYLGTEKAHKLAKEEGLHVPRALFTGVDEAHTNEYDKLLRQAQELGIGIQYLWAEDSSALFPVVKKYPDMMFVMFFKSIPDESVIPSLVKAENVLAVFDHKDENVPTFVKKLEDNKVLYSLYENYGTEDLSSIRDLSVFDTFPDLSPIIFFFFSKEETSAYFKEIGQLFRKMRKQQVLPCIPWETDQDSRLLNSLFLRKDTMFHITKDGSFKEDPSKNVYNDSLRNILKQAS